jgi:NitT/TauT family transport system substrate-binding protein
LTLALLLTACGALTESTPEPTKLKVTLLPFLGFAPIAIAQEEGFFAKEGLEVEYVQFLSTRDTVVPLVQGDLDVLIGMLNPGILNAITRGGNLKIVADKGYIDPDGCAYAGIVAQRALLESGALEDPAQLRGKRLSMTPGLPENFFVDLALAQYGVGVEELENESIPPPNQPDALANDAVDLVSSAEPTLSRILGSGDTGLWIDARDIVPGLQWAVIVYGPSLLEDNPEAGERFMRAYLKAVKQYNQGKTERNLEIVSALTGLPTEALEQACWSSIREDGIPSSQSILDYQAWALENGYLDSVVPEEEFWDARFVEAAQD